MTIEEKKEKLIRIINHLGEEELDKVIEVVNNFDIDNKEYIDEETFQRILKETTAEHEEVWKKLAL